MVAQSWGWCWGLRQRSDNAIVGNSICPWQVRILGSGAYERQNRYKGNKDAEAALIAKLKDGKGHMKVAASDAELKTLVQYVLSQK